MQARSSATASSRALGAAADTRVAGAGGAQRRVQRGGGPYTLFIVM